MFTPLVSFAANAPRVSPAPVSRRAIRIPAVESFALAALCLLDLGSTLWWVSTHDAAEGNPLMAYFLAHGGLTAFVLAKMVSFVAPLAFAEWARRRNPRFVHAALRVGVGAYIGLYFLGVAHINHAQADAPVEYPAPFTARLVQNGK